MQAFFLGTPLPSKPEHGFARFRMSFLSRRLRENGKKRDARIERAREVRELLDEEQHRMNVERYNDKQVKLQMFLD